MPSQKKGIFEDRGHLRDRNSERRGASKDESRPPYFLAFAATGAGAISPAGNSGCGKTQPKLRRHAVLRPHRASRAFVRNGGLFVCGVVITISRKAASTRAAT